jgi:hypothetical protein
MLVRAGADVQARNAAGETPHDVALSQWRWSTAARLSDLARGGSTSPDPGSADDAVARVSALDPPAASADGAAAKAE